MKIISWNVNGIRAVIKKNFAEFLTEHQPDILCLQETKARAEQVDLALLALERRGLHCDEIYDALQLVLEANGHLSGMSGTCQGHVRDMLGTWLGRIRAIFETYSRDIRDISGHIRDIWTQDILGTYGHIRTY